MTNTKRNNTAVKLALYALLTIEGQAPKPSAYEDHDLLVV